MNIASSAARCSGAFSDLTSSLHGDAIQDALVKEHGRFKIWMGNLGAQRASGTRSLEYRLRDSQNLRKRVISLLNDLYAELRRCG